MTERLNEAGLRRIRRKDRQRRVRTFSLATVAPLLTLLATVLISPPSCSLQSESSSTWYPCITLVNAQGVRSDNSDEIDDKQEGYIRKKLTRTRGGGAQQVVAPSQSNAKPLTLNQILIKAGKRGIGGGIPGAIAGMIQVFTLMWLRTIINYQCRYGTTFRQALHVLLREGGIERLYRGISFALIQAPLARFVGTAANDGVESLLANFEFTRSWGPGRSTIVASFFVGAWRMLLMPIDTMKTVLQVDSAEGFRSLMRRVRGGRIGVLYEGAIANAFAAILGHYPWFYTYNFFTNSAWIHDLIPSQLLRNAAIGLVASIISDTVVNAIRVIKTTKQAIGSKHAITYTDTVRMILSADGWQGFARGLQTRIFANALQSVLFTIVWRGLAEKWSRKKSDSRREENSTK